MARHAITRWLFVVAVIAMPLSYGVKKIFDLIQITWIDPTLVLAVPLFVFLGWPIRKSIDVGFVLYAFASALVGWGLLAPSFDRPHSAAYTVFMEPFRLLLNMLWFWCVCKVLLVDRRLVITALATA